jgi:hypothetical protein
MMMRSLSSSIKRKTKKKLFPGSGKTKRGGSSRADRRSQHDAGNDETDDTLYGLTRSADSAGNSYESLERAKKEGKAFELQNMDEVRQAHVERDMAKAMGPVALEFKADVQMEPLPVTPNGSETNLLEATSTAASEMTSTTTTADKGKEKVEDEEELLNIVYGDADYYVLLILTHLPREVQLSHSTHARTQLECVRLLTRHSSLAGAVQDIHVSSADGPVERGPDVQAPQGRLRGRVPLAQPLLRTRA